MAKVKKVGFNFFRPIIEKENGDEVFINLKPLFDIIKKNYQSARESKIAEEYKYVYTYNNEPARLADITIDVDTQYYHLIFERLDYQLPNRTTLHGESKMLDLQEDEFIGIDVSVLYDSENHIMMIQRNRSSLGPAGIEKFIRTLLQTTGEEGTFNLAIVSDTTAKRRAFNQSSYRKIQMKIIGTKADGLVEKLFSKNAGGIESVEISFNSKTGKNDKLDDEFSKRILEEYIDNDEVVRLQIRAREEEEGIVEPLDLIDHKMQTYIMFDFIGDRQLNAISVFYEMTNKYINGGYKNKILRK
ncbi:hypothetical protein IFR10_09455 [Bacillus sp. CFBP 13597]|nr:hypothetical protein [Bacillus sp. CFBP 13597]